MNQWMEAQQKWNGEKKELEKALSDVTSPGEGEFEDTTCLDHNGLVCRSDKLERSSVGVASHSFNNAMELVKVVNPKIEFLVEGIHYLKYVENEVLVSPP